MQGSVTRMGLHYRMYASSATARGTLGVQCWVRNNTSNFVLLAVGVASSYVRCFSFSQSFRQREHKGLQLPSP